jgi:hypothetical protein
MKWGSLIFGVIAIGYVVMAQDALVPALRREHLFWIIVLTMLVPSSISLSLGAIAVCNSRRLTDAIPAYFGIAASVLSMIMLVMWVEDWLRGT